VIGGNGTTLAVMNSFRPSQPGEIVTAHLIPLAMTPMGIAVGTARQAIGLPLRGLYDWIDRTFPPQDEQAFVAPIRDAELLARVGWDSPLPDSIGADSIVNLEDIPEDIAEGLMRDPVALTQCAACRRLSVAGDFLWKGKELCAWDFHAQVFGKRGPWRDEPYEPRYFETLAECSYVAPPLLNELGVEIILTVNGVADSVAQRVVNAALTGDPGHAHMAVRAAGGLTVLREAPAAKIEG
jgi:hypothetical protein